MTIKVALDYHLLNRLRTVGGEALADLGPLTAAHVKTVFAASKQHVPIGDDEPDTDKNPPLFTTGFVDGPVVRLERQSVTSTCGYLHPAAGPIHEGVHWGVQLKQSPPHFLRKPARRGRAGFKKAVAKQLMSTLNRLFPPTK